MSAHHCQQHTEIRVAHIFRETFLLFCKSSLRHYLIQNVAEAHIAELILHFVDILQNEAELLLAFGSFLVCEVYRDCRRRYRDCFPAMLKNRKTAAMSLSPLFPFLWCLQMQHPNMRATPLRVDERPGTLLFVGAYTIKYQGYKCKMEFGIEEGDWMSFSWYFQHPWPTSWDTLTPRLLAAEHCRERATFWQYPQWFDRAAFCSNGYWDMKPEWDIQKCFYTMHSLASKRLGPLRNWGNVSTDRTHFEYGDNGLFWTKGSWTAPPTKRRKIMHFTY